MELDSIRLRDTDEGSTTSDGVSPSSSEIVATSDMQDQNEINSPDFQDDESIPLSVKLSYGAPQFATMSLTFLINVYGNRFYTQMGAQLSSLAFFTALARSLDVMTDPLMGKYILFPQSPLFHCFTFSLVPPRVVQ